MIDCIPEAINSSIQAQISWLRERLAVGHR